LPIATWPWLAQYIYDIFENHTIIFNTIILTGQLACIYFISSPRKIILITLFYDLTHLLIFLLSGIFFWKWIILNILIIAAIGQFKGVTFNTHQKTIGIASTVFGILFFFTAQLAWYDTNSLRHVYVEAIDDKGQTYQVPTNYFLNTSVTFTQGRFLKDTPGHFFEIDSLGSTSKFEAKINSAKKELSVYEGNGGNIEIGELAQLISTHHSYILTNTDENGRFQYNQFPHHVWSNPLSYTSFRKLDKRRIKAYRAVIESKYLSLEKGRVKRNIISHHASDSITIQQPHKKTESPTRYHEHR